MTGMHHHASLFVIVIIQIQSHYVGQDEFKFLVTTHAPRGSLGAREQRVGIQKPAAGHRRQNMLEEYSEKELSL